MKPSELKIGNVYFVCSWWAIDRPVPEIATWIYSGTDNTNESEIKYCFQDPESYYLETILSELTEEQRESYTKPKGSKIILVAESELEDLVYNLREMKEFVSELRSEKNAEHIYS